jgi:hypothetical protein
MIRRRSHESRHGHLGSENIMFVDSDRTLALRLETRILGMFRDRETRTHQRTRTWRSKGSVNLFITQTPSRSPTAFRVKCLVSSDYIDRHAGD